jgi:hypothetical protein
MSELEMLVSVLLSGISMGLTLGYIWGRAVERRSHDA